jgi:hypothetical protein
MARKGQCQTCKHPEVAEIDRLLLSGDEGGTRKLAVKYGLSRTSLQYHKTRHMAKALAMASGAVITKVDPDPAGLVQQVADLERRARALLDKAEDGEDLSTALRAIAELRNLVELLAKLAGEISGTGLSRAEVKRIGREMAQVVEAVVRDPEQLERIRDAWTRIRF